MHPEETPELAALPAPDEAPTEVDPGTAFAARGAGVDLVTLQFEDTTIRRPGIALDLVPITDVHAEPQPQTLVLTVPQAYGVVAGLVDALTILEEAGEIVSLSDPTEAPASADETTEV